MIERPRATTAQRLTPAAAVVAVLQANGVDAVFGMDGSHVVTIFDALLDAPGIRRIHCMHEGNAAIAAEYYGRLTGRPGICLVTAGPGATNSMTGVAGALAIGAPMVHISGGVPTTSGLEAFHGVDDPRFLDRAFASMVKWTTRVEQPAGIVPALNKAFAIAVAGRPGPVHVEIAQDVMRSGPKPEPIEVEIGPADAPSTARPADLDRLVARIARAERPIIVAGKGALRGSVSPAMVALAERIGAPILDTFDSQAATPSDHPLSAGFFWDVRSSPFVLKLFQTADLVIAVGVRPNTDAARSLGRNVAGDLLILEAADEPPAGQPWIGSVPALEATLQALAAAVPERPASAELLAETAESKARFARAMARWLDKYRTAGPRQWPIALALAGLAPHMDAETVLVTDSAAHKLWVPYVCPSFGPISHQQCGTWGSMGYGITGALGAAVACPDKKVVGFCGDGSFLMASADFGTLGRLGRNVIIPVHHDGHLGMINGMHQNQFGRVAGTEIPDVDLVRYAEAFGARGIRVATPDRIAPAWEEAFAADGVVLIDFLAGHQFGFPTVQKILEEAES
ncbi:MAG: thiamine pyrophosphate-binding protein [Chloroflexi bacterium]|nr:thiamine pyrophosphate-binding protein [Chloroflexota bacterium]